jgi:pimeloyl-ACP methyl ester carboxylesterase
VAYAEAGPADSPAVILLHGWPYDIHSFVDVTPMLAATGYRVLFPICAGTERRAFLRAEQQWPARGIGGRCRRV